MNNVWCEVYFNAIEYNLDLIKSKTHKKIIAVVKANAYGLGIEEVSKFLDDKVDMFAVVNFDEAEKISSDKDILILAPQYFKEDYHRIKKNYILTIDDDESSINLLKYMEVNNMKNRLHILLDLGMNRFGIKLESAKSSISRLLVLARSIDSKNNLIEGIYGHLHNTSDRRCTLKQIESFKEILSQYKSVFSAVHLFNSSGLLNYDSFLDSDTHIRVGNIIYGYNCSQMGFKKAFNIFAKPIRVYTVPKGQYIGYGNLYETRRDMKVGILEIGYIDSFDCEPKVKNNIFYDLVKLVYYRLKYYSEVTYNGKFVEVLGRPNMNYTIVNMDGVDSDAVFSLNSSPIILDSSIAKVYKGD